MVTLIIVDFQNDFCLESGALYVKGATNAMWNIEALLESGDISRVIFTADWHMWKHPSFEEQGGPWPMHCVQYSTGAAISELLLSACRNNDIPHEVVTKGLYKEQYGAFKDFHIDEDGDMCFDNETNLNDWLYFEDYRDAEYYICGLAGDYCVLETIKNLKPIWDRLRVYLPGIASIDGGETLNNFIKENNLKVIEQ